MKGSESKEHESDSESHACFFWNNSPSEGGSPSTFRASFVHTQESWTRWEGPSSGEGERGLGREPGSVTDKGVGGHNCLAHVWVQTVVSVTSTPRHQQRKQSAKVKRKASGQQDGSAGKALAARPDT